MTAAVEDTDLIVEDIAVDVKDTTAAWVTRRSSYMIGKTDSKLSPPLLPSSDFSCVFTAESVLAERLRRTKDCGIPGFSFDPV